MDIELWPMYFPYSYGYRVMAHRLTTLVMAYIAMAYIVMAFIGMAYTVMARSQIAVPL